MRLLPLSLLTLIALPAATPAQPAPAADPVRPPATALGRAASALLDAVDAGDSAAAAHWVAAHMGHDVRGRSPAAIASMLVTLHAQGGGQRLERARETGDGTLLMLTRARNGRRWLGIELDPATGDSDRVADLLFVPMDDPTRGGPPAPWAAGPLTDAQLADLVRRKVRAAADSDAFSGVVLVAHGDRVLVHEAVGEADRARHLPVMRDTRFAVASLGKMFTGVAVAQLVAQGRLRWDDTLAAVLPEYPNREAARRITIRQLLTHTAGVPDPFQSGRFDAAHDYGTQARLLATFADAPLTANAGKGFAYSNGNFAALAAVVERLSGERWVDYLRRHVWAPAGMRLPAGAPAVGYARFAVTDPLGLEARRAEAVGAGPLSGGPLGFGGGAYTAEDLFRFARALRTGRLVPPALADTLTTGHVSMGGPMQYGFGFSVRPVDGGRVVGHSGSNPDTGHDADLEMAWEGEWTVVVLSNYDAPAGLMLSNPITELVARQGARAMAPGR